MIGPGAEETDAESVSLIPAGESIDNVEASPGVEIVNGEFSINTPDLECRLGIGSPGPGL